MSEGAKRYLTPIVSKFAPKYNLSQEQISWIVENLSNETWSEARRGSVPLEVLNNKIERLLHWARETGKNFQLMSERDVTTEMNQWYSSQAIQEPNVKRLFEDYGWIFETQLFNDPKSIQTAAKIHSTLPSGLTEEEALWLPRILNHYMKSYTVESLTEYMVGIFNRSRELKIDITSSENLQDAEKYIITSSEYAKKIQIAKNYSKQEPIDRLEGGWRVFQLSPGGQDIEEQDLEREESIMDIRFLNIHNPVVSFRDKNGVPCATLELQYTKDPLALEVVNAQINPEAKSSVKEWIMKLKAQGYNPIWVESVNDVDDAEDLSNLHMADIGIAPFAAGFGGDVNTYMSNIGAIYQTSTRHSEYYSRRASTRLENLAWYACERNEQDLLNQAIERFSDDTNDWFSEDMSQRDLSYPSSDDYETDEEFKAAEAAYYEEEERYSDDYGPFKFVKDAEETLNTIIQTYKKQTEEELKKVHQKIGEEQFNKTLEDTIRDMPDDDNYSIASGKNWYRKALKVQSKFL